jgi:hypothetical protein
MPNYHVLITHSESGINKDVYVASSTEAAAEVDACVAAAHDATFFGTDNNSGDYASLSVEEIQ